jgi:hypothetical protein
MASLGNASALLEALDAALENGSRHQRDVAAGQSTLFDLFALPAEGAGTAFLDGGEEIPKRERLRWEKELIGLYLSDHPLSEIEQELPDYATALVVDLAEEADQTKVTLGGIVAGSRRVITRAGQTMLVATLEDLTGSVEVVVFPKVYEQTAPAWADDSIVLVSGRLDRRDEAPQILCEAVWAWDDAVRMGVEGFSVERDRILAPRGRWDQRNGKPPPPREAIPVEVPAPVAVSVGAPEPAEESPAPSDAVPLQAAPAGSSATVAVLLGDDVPNERLLGAIESVKGALAARPGPLPVTLSISVAGASRQVRLPDRVAWDERLADALRRAAGVPVSVELQPAIEASGS